MLIACQFGRFKKHVGQLPSLRQFEGDDAVVFADAVSRF